MKINWSKCWGYIKVVLVILAIIIYGGGIFFDIYYHLPQKLRQQKVEENLEWYKPAKDYQVVMIKNYDLVIDDGDLWVKRAHTKCPPPQSYSVPISFRIIADENGQVIECVWGGTSIPPTNP